MSTLTKQIEIKNIDQFPVGIGQVILYKGEELAVFRLASGEVYAIENKSPHPKGGKLADGLVSDHYLFCPIHDWKISLIDGQVQAPDQGHVRTFPVREVGDDIIIDL
ncbi:nitrite reductase small subunit NirD [Halalkalibacter krulwichiae]|uniref:Assimilatory nitrite reductase [NAD(P)H] small subunit n=1 Tax=Halalkalibacter krulwichiae TaxID=199441 RepID=A0A1X9MAR3_9BACI|nr:nitrite reductase small subunit NirD [Halalkalibacter krulwichiae]ARK30488.1 Assimilatory nitrite reductase [NAD(P)H] small subunit [Halalkalibacter krulwichiae]